MKTQTWGKRQRHGLHPRRLVHARRPQKLGDGRLTMLGTEGFMELRKNINPGGRDGGNHLLIIDNKETCYIDCSKKPLPYGE